VFIINYMFVYLILTSVSTLAYYGRIWQMAKGWPAKYNANFVSMSKLSLENWLLVSAVCW
jgi:hypothetical protein